MTAAVGAALIVQGLDEAVEVDALLDELADVLDLAPVVAGELPKRRRITSIASTLSVVTEMRATPTSSARATTAAPGT